MSRSWVLALTTITAVGAAVIAGLLFAFSTAVMKALQQLPAEQGMAAMRHINVVIINPLFMAFFLGTAFSGVVLAVHAVLNFDTPGAAWLLGGALAYLLGAFGVTMAFNVPLNNALAASDLSASSAATTWPRYVQAWLRWNHVRTLMGIVAAFALVVAAIRRA